MFKTLKPNKIKGRKGVEKRNYQNQLNGIDTSAKSPSENKVLQGGNGIERMGKHQERVSDFESDGFGFESQRVRQLHVAQMAERRIVAPVVGGSSPLVHPIGNISSTGRAFG